MMLDNSTYNKTKLLYKISDLLWFIEKHALADAQVAGDQQCIIMLEEIKKDCQKHVARLQSTMCIVSQ